MFLEKSVFKSTHIHVWKDNGPQLWGEVQSQVSNFLLGLYHASYFAGTSPEEAFFVICNATNNPQNTVDEGFTFCDVGAAPHKPSKFLVFRFAQKTL